MKNEKVPCVKCGSSTKYYDKVKRIVKGKNGKKRRISVKRYACPNCGSVHRLIPDYILPYKHYERTIIEGFISGNLSSNQLEYEDYPCEATVAIWKRYHLPLTFI